MDTYRVEGDLEALLVVDVVPKRVQENDRGPLHLQIVVAREMLLCSVHHVLVEDLRQTRMESAGADSSSKHTPSVVCCVLRVGTSASSHLAVFAFGDVDQSVRVCGDDVTDVVDERRFDSVLDLGAEGEW